MASNHIVVGVDDSPEAAWAAALGASLAQAAGTRCQLVHATRAVLSALALAELPERSEEFAAGQIALARERVSHTLWGVVPAALLEQIIIRIGRPAMVLKEVVAEVGAGLVVLGGKRHSVLGRWLAGSTGVDVARTTEVALLVTGRGRAPIHNILAAVDVSAAAAPTIAAAEHYAAVLGAQLRVISVHEPMPFMSDANYHTAEYYNVLEEHVIQQVWPLVTAPRAEKFVRYGTPAEQILEEAAAWEADLVVVGSHGKGWVDRLLMGSVTERLLNELPTSLLVVPVAVHVKSRNAGQRAAYAPRRAEASHAIPIGH